MASADIRIALFTGYPNYYPYPLKTLIPYSYLYPRENIRICIRIRTIRELSEPKGICIRFYLEQTETIRSAFIPTHEHKRPN